MHGYVTSPFHLFANRSDYDYRARVGSHDGFTSLTFLQNRTCAIQSPIHTYEHGRTKGPVTWTVSPQGTHPEVEKKNPKVVHVVPEEKTSGRHSNYIRKCFARSSYAFLPTLSQTAREHFICRTRSFICSTQYSPLIHYLWFIGPNIGISLQPLRPFLSMGEGFREHPLFPPLRN
jgi:hypothetical protein